MECNDYNVLKKDCISREILGLIGNKWTVLVLHALQEPIRYSALQRRVNGITQKVLTTTLRDLERNGIVARTVYPVIPPHVEYDLTLLGRGLLDSLEALVDWSQINAGLIAEHRKAYDEQK